MNIRSAFWIVSCVTMTFTVSDTADYGKCVLKW